jgi:hypothetical protein
VWIIHQKEDAKHQIPNLHYFLIEILPLTHYINDSIDTTTTTTTKSKN